MQNLKKLVVQSRLIRSIFKIPVYCNYNIMNGFNVPYARTILGRDYKGFGTGSETTTGILEIG